MLNNIPVRSDLCAKTALLKYEYSNIHISICVCVRSVKYKRYEKSMFQYFVRTASFSTLLFYYTLEFYVELCPRWNHTPLNVDFDPGILAWYTLGWTLYI